MSLGHGSSGTGVDWIHVAADRTHWRALVDAIMDCRLWHTSGTGSESSASLEDAHFTYQLRMKRKGRRVHSPVMRLQLSQMSDNPDRNTENEK